MNFSTNVILLTVCLTGVLACPKKATTVVTTTLPPRTAAVEDVVYFDDSVAEYTPEECPSVPEKIESMTLAALAPMNFHLSPGNWECRVSMSRANLNVTLFNTTKCNSGTYYAAVTVDDMYVLCSNKTHTLPSSFQLCTLHA